MKAMVLAAGLGTRLRPLTDSRPKALVEIAGRTLLEITLSRLREFGVREVIVNAHHFTAMIVDYLKANDNFGLRIEVSREDILLDTGGGLKKAAYFFLEGRGVLDEPFILHNVDVISAIDLRRMLQFHVENKAMATLAVQQRHSSRYLLFDQHGQLCGRRLMSSAKAGNPPQDEIVRSSSPLSTLAFSGIHVISPRIFALMPEENVFSIIDCYLQLAARGERILAFRADEYYWRDLGTPENLREAEKDFARGALQ